MMINIIFEIDFYRILFSVSILRQEIVNSNLLKFLIKS